MKCYVPGSWFMASSLPGTLYSKTISSKSMAVNFKISNPSKLLIHCIVWAGIFMLPYVFNIGDERDEASSVDPFRNINTVTNFLWMGMFYFNTAVFIPRLFYKKKYGVYTLLLLGSFCIT